MKSGDVKFAVIAAKRGCALVAARDGAVVASMLPQGTAKQQEARLRLRFPDAVAADPAEVVGADAMARWLEGDAGALAGVPVVLDDLPPFARRVYAALRRVKPGSTVTYADLARRAGSPGAFRAVGGAMARNPLAPFVPCHRVVGSDGSLTGFSAAGGLATKEALLRAEGAKVRGTDGGRSNP